MLVVLKQTRQPRRTLPHAGCLPAWSCSALLRVSGPVSAPCAASHCAFTKLRPWRAARASRPTTAGVPGAPAKLAINPCRRSSPELSSLALDSVRPSSASPALFPARHGRPRGSGLLPLNRMPASLACVGNKLNLEFNLHNIYIYSSKHNP
jgi:hypothetical protein